jgi:hypothetical protein
MATTTTNFGWDIPQSTDFVKDGATAIAALGQDIDTALVDLKGGTTGQVLAKATNTDLDFSWVAQDDSNAIQNAIVDAKGDLIGATAADTPARLAVGTNGQVLTADSTAATGLAWATPAAGGGMTLINTGGTALSGATTTVSSIPGTYKHLFLVWERVSVASGAAGESVYIRLNTDSGSNYTYQTIMSAATTLTGRGDLDNTSFEAGVRTNESTDVQYQNYGQAWIRNYTNTTSVACSWQTNSCTTTPTAVSCVGSGVYDNSAAITSVSLTVGSTTFATGTMYVYGVN